MCFWHDIADWHADVVEQNEFVCVNEKCRECYRNMPGMTMHAIYQQQYEECSDCENGYCSCEKECCECSGPNYGEEYYYYCCNDCHLFLQSIKEAEIEEGCHVNEAQPSLESMQEEISQVGIQDAKRYFKKAAKLHPELVKSKYLGWLWRQIF